MKLTAAHKQLIKLLAAAAVAQFTEEQKQAAPTRCGGSGRPKEKGEAMPELEKINITQFTYDPDTRKFYRAG